MLASSTFQRPPLKASARSRSPRVALVFSGGRVQGDAGTSRWWFISSILDTYFKTRWITQQRGLSLRIIEKFRLAGRSQSRQSKPLLRSGLTSKLEQIAQGLSRRVLKMSEDQEFAASLGTFFGAEPLVLWLIFFFFLLSDQNFLHHNLWPFSLVLLLCTFEKTHVPPALRLAFS